MRTSLFVIAPSLVPSILSAAVGFTEDFNNNSVGPNLFVSVSNGLGSPDFSTGAAVFDDSGLAARSYIATIASDYQTNDFVAEITLTRTTASTSDNGDAVFWGFGPGTVPGNFTSSFREPTIGPSSYVRIGLDVRATDYDEGNATGTAWGFPAVGTSTLGIGSHRLRMEYSALAQTLTFSVDDDNDGSGFDQFVTVIDLSDNGFDSTNSRIVFGGVSGASFDDLSITVVPEPSSFFMLGMAFIFLSRRSRV